MRKEIRREIPYWKMIANVRYVVVEPGKDKTFCAGDHIRQLPDGDIICTEAQGWINSEEVPAAAEGMIVIPDTEWAENQILSLKRQIKTIEEQYSLNILI